MRIKLEFSNQENKARYDSVYSRGYQGAPDEYDNENPYIDGYFDLILAFDDHEKKLIAKVDKGSFTVTCNSFEASYDLSGINPPEYDEIEKEYSFNDFDVDLEGTIELNEEIVIEEMDILFDENKIKIEIA
jgi:hypothetical protein